MTVKAIKFIGESTVPTPLMAAAPDVSAGDGIPSARLSAMTGPPNDASSVLAVPSVLVPQELNYRLNPLHRGFSSVVPDNEPRVWFDPRLKNNC